MYKVIPSCLNCSLIFTTEEGYQLTAIFHTFGTETGPGGACSKNRLDVYSGAMTVKEDLLSSRWLHQGGGGGVKALGTPS